MSEEKRPVVCPCCGAKTVEYRHSLSKGVLSALVKFHDKAGARPLALSEIGLSLSQVTNFQKLRYWDLVEPFVTSENKRRGGFWAITGIGYLFIRGQYRVQKIAVSYRGIARRFEGEIVSISDVLDGYQYRGDYRDQIKEAGADPTPMML